LPYTEFMLVPEQRFRPLRGPESQTNFPGNQRCFQGINFRQECSISEDRVR
jgi:hypothetical protein